MSGVVCTDEVADTVLDSQSRPAIGHIYSNHPVATAAGVAVLDRMERDRLVEHAEKAGRRLRQRLEECSVRHPVVGDVRGVGLLRAIELVADGRTRTPFDPGRRMTARLVRACLDVGLLVYPASGGIDGDRGDAVVIASPLTIDDDEVDELGHLLDQALAALETEETRRATAGTPDARAGSDFVRSFERGIAVIKAFDESSPEMTLSEVARATELTRAAARRFLLTLVELGYVRTDGKQFSLRPRVLELGYAYLSSLCFPEVAAPHMEALVSRVHESCSISVLDGDEVVYVARVPTKRIMTVAISVGTRFPAYATSMGRVLLAHQPSEWLDHYLSSTEFQPLTRRTITDPKRLQKMLDGVRKQGFALVDQELEDGLRAIAAPIRDRHDHVFAAMNVSAPASRGPSESVRRELLPELLRAIALTADDLRSAGH